MLKYFNFISARCCLSILSSRLTSGSLSSDSWRMTDLLA